MKKEKEKGNEKMKHLVQPCLGRQQVWFVRQSPQKHASQHALEPGATESCFVLNKYHRQ